MLSMVILPCLARSKCAYSIGLRPLTPYWGEARALRLARRPWPSQRWYRSRLFHRPHRVRCIEHIEVLGAPVSFRVNAVAREVL